MTHDQYHHAIDVVARVLPEAGRLSIRPELEGLGVTIHDRDPSVLATLQAIGATVAPTVGRTDGWYGGPPCWQREWWVQVDGVLLIALEHTSQIPEPPEEVA